MRPLRPPAGASRPLAALHLRLAVQRPPEAREDRPRVPPAPGDPVWHHGWSTGSALAEYRHAPGVNQALSRVDRKRRNGRPPYFAHANVATTARLAPFGGALLAALAAIGETRACIC